MNYILVTLWYIAYFLTNLLKKRKKEYMCFSGKSGKKHQICDIYVLYKSETKTLMTAEKKF